MSDAVVASLFLIAVLVTVAGLAWVFRSSPGLSRTTDEDEPIAVATGGEAEIAIMVGKLSEAGIKALARDRLAEAANPMYGWELLVRYADAEKARRILDLD
jgi:hypothetical protein